MGAYEFTLFKSGNYEDDDKPQVGELIVSAHHDVADAVTRFVVLRRPCVAPEPSGADRTTVVAFIGEDHPGALLEILTEFSMRGINLTLIQSRPTGAGLGSSIGDEEFRLVQFGMP